MPWPMVHFAISETLFDGHPSPHLLLGSIAPDAVHMRGQISREEKGATHLIHNGEFSDKELIAEKCLEYLRKRSEPEWKDFVIGYFTHVYTDARWTYTLYANFEQNCTGAKNEIRQIYNREVSQVEFELLRSMRSAKNLIALLSKADGYTIDPYVTQLEVNQYRDLKLEWLQNPHHEPRITPIYFKPGEIWSFINETTKQLKDLLNN